MQQLKSNRILTENEKFFLLTNPPRNFNFPCRLIGGHFQWNWLGKFNGLVYSEYDNGGYCVLFARGGPIKALGALVNKPLIDFKRATEKLSDHFAKKFHKTAVELAESFSVVMKNPELIIV